MRTNNFRAVACAALCAALACTPARADEKAEQSPSKKPAVVPFAPGIDPVDTARNLRKLMPAETFILPVPFADALLVYATEDEVREIRQMVRPL
jgi:hypothetical protein